MNIKFAVPGTLAAACLTLLLMSTARAATYTEGSTDAGDLPATATVINTMPAGTPLTSIIGMLTITTNRSESDLYEIYINSPGTFSASLTVFVPGSNNFDSQLALFTLTGKGIALDDDDPTTGSPSANLPAGTSQITALTPGAYYLLVTGSGRNPASTGGLIFPNYSDGTTDPTVVQGPTGPGGAGVLSTYAGSSSVGGNYSVALAGAQFVPPVPEPATYVYIAAGLAGLVFVTRTLPRRSRNRSFLAVQRLLYRRGA